MLKKPFLIFFAGIYTLLIFAGGFWLGYSGDLLRLVGAPSAAVPAEAAELFDPFWETWNVVNDRYYDQPLEPTTLMEGAIDGMLETLGDPNTRYLPPAAEETAREDMEGEIEGIGVLVEMVDDEIVIVSPFEGSPADAAGLEPGDILREADGVDLAGMDLREAAELIRGPAGTTVELMVQRDDTLFTVEVKRDIIRIPSVRGEMFDDGVAYVRLSRFGNRTADELAEVLEELVAEQPSGLILDLRNNPGGGLNTAIDVADQFLEEGIVLVERFGSGEERVFESGDRGLAEDIPMVVLINEGSASASEVLAGALRDRDRATLIGVTSFGKGTVQTWLELSNGGGVRVTIARWLTPDGTWVNEEGLEPDLIVELPESVDEGTEPLDTQLEAALDYLNNRELQEEAEAAQE